MAGRRRLGRPRKFNAPNGSIRFNDDAELVLEGLAAGDLRKHAERIKGRVQLPSSGPAAGRLELSVKAGMGPNGAFGQVIMTGPGALAVEFGTRRSAPRAPLRRALRGG